MSLAWLALAAFAEPHVAVPDCVLTEAGCETRTALSHVRVWDATEGLREVEAVVLDGETIVSVGDLPADLGAEYIQDMAGATVIPGLMDLHVHLSLIPSGAFRDDDREAFGKHHLAAYVACGVTTVLDTGIPIDEAHRFRRLEGSGPSPDLHFLGPLVSPPDGYVSVVLPEFPAAATAEDVAEQFAAFDAIKPFGVKATVEEGMLLPVWPLYSEEVATAVFAEAEARDIGVYAHAMSRKEYQHALDLGVAGFVHPTQKPTDKLIRQLVQQELWVISTLAVFDALLVEFEPERLERPLVQAVVPQVELEAAADPIIWEKYKDGVVAAMLPGREGMVAKLVRNMLDKPAMVHGRLNKMQRSIGKQFEAGVPIVLGSDSGNWPIFPSEFHGPTTLSELELLVDSGLSPTDALTAATYTPARMLGIENEVGTIAPGMRADLVVLRDDVTEDISAVWEPIWVVRRGEGDTPEGWMGRAR
ncbi:MAG: amidohydrolase family protein [Proteobacteria bacterium]|nr:amidohydrolase family protein [Pseudomonadota bacterium]